MTLLVWSTDIVGRLGLWPEDKQRRPGVGSRPTWLYRNYYYESSYKYGHPMSVMEKLAVHIHALNKKSRQWSPSYCNHTTNCFGPYNSHNCCDIQGRMFLSICQEVPIILPVLFLSKSMLLLLLFHWVFIFIELPFAISLSTSTKVYFLLLRLWRVTRMTMSMMGYAVYLLCNVI